jgi:hypothetical protein
MDKGAEKRRGESCFDLKVREEENDDGTDKT